MRIAFHRILALLLITLFIAVGQTPFSAPLARGGTTTSAYLTLDITPASAPVGSLVTLHIAYHGVGLYDTSILLTPDQALRFDPPRSMPCRYNQDATNCTEFTFRAQTPGTVTIHASAYGEIYDTDCSCWRFTGVSDDAPAVLTITGSRAFLPVVQR